MSKSIRLAIVDPYQPVRYSLRLLLEDTPDICFVGEANAATAMLDICEHARPDVMLFDFASQVEDVYLIKQFRQRHPELKVLVLTTNMDANCVRTAIRAGVNGYVFKALELNELRQAIRAVHQGKQVFDPEIEKFISD